MARNQHYAPAIREARRNPISKMKASLLSRVIVILFVAVSNPVQAGNFFQDFSSSAIGATNFADGAQLFSTDYSAAQVVLSPHNELQLTANGTGNVWRRRICCRTYRIPNTPVYAFSAKWNTPVQGSFPSSADGFSFNFGQLTIFNLADPGLSQESGYDVGLSFDVQTYSGNQPRILYPRQWQDAGQCAL